MSLVFLAAALLTARGGPEAGVSGAPAGRSDRLTHAGGPPLGEWLGRKIFGHFWVCDQRVRHGDRCVFLVDPLRFLYAQLTLISPICAVRLLRGEHTWDSIDTGD